MKNKSRSRIKTLTPFELNLGGQRIQVEVENRTPGIQAYYWHERLNGRLIRHRAHTKELVLEWARKALAQQQ